MSNVSTRRAGRTRWRRFAMVVVPSIAAALGIVLLEGQGALAASFYISGIPFTITASELDGTGFNQYGGIDGAQANSQAGINAYNPVAVTGINSASIYDMCQQVVLPVPIIGNASMVIRAGSKVDPTTGKKVPVEASNMYIDMLSMEGDATFTNIDVGIDASDTAHFTKGPKPAYAPQNMFAQQADSMKILHLNQKAVSTSAGSFSLNGMSLNLYTGADIAKNACQVP